MNGNLNRTRARTIGLVVVAATAAALLAAGLVHAQQPARINVGIVGAIDQLGVPVALDRGIFEKWSLDVNIASPYPTGVDLLNALQAGQIRIGQVGVPLIGAVLRGMDLVILGNYTGSSVRVGGDDTMALVTRDGTNIRRIQDLRGKRIAISFGTISHLYMLGILERAGLAVADVTLVNTPPPEMPVALRGGAVDAFATWDPWPVLALRDVPNAYEVVRGGGHIGFMGFLVAERGWAQQNQAVIERFLAARAEADQFMRGNAQATAQIATRWLTALNPEVALLGVRNNLPTLDIRISRFTYEALHTGMSTLNRLGFLDDTFDVNRVFMPGPILNVMRDHPELFNDLPPIPASAQVTPGFIYRP